MANHWRVLSPDEQDGKLRCLCTICNTEHMVNKRNLLSQKTTKCRQCANEANKKNGNGVWSGYGDIPGKYWNNLRRQGSRKHKHKFDITIEYAWRLFVKQNKKCALTGLPLNFQCGNTIGNASLDRIDNSKGYIKGNVQWVHKIINAMKSDFLLSTFVEFCGLVAKNYGQEKK